MRRMKLPFLRYSNVLFTAMQLLKENMGSVSSFISVNKATLTESLQRHKVSTVTINHTCISRFSSLRGFFLKASNGNVEKKNPMFPGWINTTRHLHTHRYTDTTHTPAHTHTTVREQELSGSGRQYGRKKP